jgi:hypothetical protein
MTPSRKTIGPHDPQRTSKGQLAMTDYARHKEATRAAVEQARTARTTKTILPAITSTYGEGSKPEALATYLAERIDNWTPHYPDETRHDMIMRICWNWYSGGSTAKIAADRVEAALSP